jgi:hypothetical protein
VGFFFVLVEGFRIIEKNEKRGGKKGKKRKNKRGRREKEKREKNKGAYVFPLISPTHKRIEGRVPVWVSEFTSKDATLQGDSAEIAPTLNV